MSDSPERVDNSSEFALDLTPMGALEVSCAVNGPIQTNTYFAVSGSEAVVVDPAWDGERLAHDFQAAHPGVAIKALICTHGHADHVGGVAGMRRALGPNVPYLLPAADADCVAPSIAWQRTEWGIDTPDPGEPDRLLNEGDIIAFGDVRLQVFSVPGHTAGGIVLFCAAKTGNVAFVGDTLFPGAHGRTDLSGGDEVQIIRSLGKMAHLMPDDTLCLIGHNGSTTIGREREQNLFMRRGLRHFR